MRGRTWIQALKFAVGGKHPKRREIAWAYVLLKLRIAVSHLSGKSLESASLLGHTIHFDDGTLFAFLFFETFLQGHYLSCSRKPRSIVDCGSNIGMSILLFKSLWPDSRLTGVEAAPATFALLEQNVRDMPGVTLMNKAVSDSHGTIALYQNHNNLLASTIAARGGADAIKVEAIPISELIEDQVDLLKIDIEGSEIAAFRELEESGRMGRVREMFIEYHHHLPGEKQELSEFLGRLERCGFTYELAATMPQTCGGFQDLFIHAVIAANA